MFSGTLKVGQLINWNAVFEATSEDGDWFVYYYAPDGVTMYKIQLDKASKETLKAKRDQIIDIRTQTITISGAIVETQKLEDVDVPASTVKQWVKQ